jgi:hypothetical protein
MYSILSETLISFDQWRGSGRRIRAILRSRALLFKHRVSPDLLPKFRGLGQTYGDLRPGSWSNSVTTDWKPLSVTSFYSFRTSVSCHDTLTRSSLDTANDEVIATFHRRHSRIISFDSLPVERSHGQWLTNDKHLLAITFVGPGTFVHDCRTMHIKLAIQS